MNLLSVQILWMTFVRILVITTQTEKKALIVLSDMIADIISNKKLQPIIKELFIRCRKLNMSFVFIAQSYFSIPRDIILNSKHYLIMNIHNKKNYKTLQLII